MHKDCIDGNRIFVIYDFLTTEECQSFISRSEKEGYNDATITTRAGFVMDKEIRDNARLIVDDVPLADQLWQRARQFLPGRDDDWRAVGVNERFRFYRYDPGQKFAPHFDGCHRRGNGEQSHLTFMVYLNDDFSGGETKFYDDEQKPRVSVRPKCGMALLFIHWQLHEGAPVVTGRKYVLRTDVMYTLEEPVENRLTSKNAV
jgi:predicted 2-oxoglutarate/Fe(II)-dependent dioxygenase YbiX